MASDPLHPGLGELGQRLQALGDPVAEPARLRPYQGGSVQAGSAQGASVQGASVQAGSVQAGSAPGKAAPPAPERTAAQPAYSGWHSVPTPAPPEPYTDLPQHSASTNGYSHVAGTTTAAEASPASTPSAATAPAAPGPAAPGPATSGPAAAPADPAIPSGIQRAINAVRNTLPLVQRLLPLLEGNIATAATAITALVAPQATVQHIHPPAPPPSPAPVPVPIDLGPIERSLGEVDRGLVEVRNSHRELKTQVAEHVTAFKRVEDQLDHVREATDRNTLEQQELVEDLRAVGSRVSTFAIIGLVLLVLSLLLNGYLIFQMQRILH